ncbi:helix-turn-helix domain-containing protein, partial [Salmonella enterica]|nr:helix-turn-helix domain-containing protein [Salmonella enterica]
SRGTVSRALTMLRLTGWLSLCKRVRDSGGRVRGNIYAQHDEPLSARDAETFDPGWLDLVADACRHKSRAVNETAWQVLTSIQDDPMMRHRHSRVTMIAERLTRLSDAAQCARIQSSTKIELSEKDAKNQAERLSSNIELSHSGDEKTLSSKRELSEESRDCSRVRKSHHNNVRSFTQSVIKKTYVSPQADKKPLTGVPEGFVWPDGLQDILPENEQPMLAHQLNQLAQTSPSVAEQVAISVVNGWRQKRISNPVGYLLVTLKQAREGKYHVEPAAPQQYPARPVIQAESSPEVKIPACPTEPHIPAGQETVKAMVARIRQRLNCSA